MMEVATQQVSPALLRKPLDTDALLQILLIAGICLWLGVVVALPLGQLLVKSLTGGQGRYVGAANFIAYFKTPALSASLYNSLSISAITTALSVGLGFFFAWGLTRADIPGKGFFRGVSLTPLFAPTLLNGIALIYLFGRQGLITRGFFGTLPSWDIGLYGATGIVIAEVIYTFPQAVLILTVALSATDARLYEASHSMGASWGRTFRIVTFPAVKYGLMSAVFVCFILAFTDFGAPKVVGGDTNVLATDIYKQVIGQQNFVMGSVVAVVLLIPTAVAFLADRIVQRKQVAMIAAKSVPYHPAPHRVRDAIFLIYCSVVSFFIIGFFATALFAALVKVWPYDLSISLVHFRFERMGGGGYAALFNSLRMSFYSALLGTAVSFVSAYLIEKSSRMKSLRRFAYFLSMLPLALPGMVIGLSYIFFFNTPGWSVFKTWIPNPFHFLYSTMALLVISNVVHFYTVSFLTATTALKQLDREFETVSQSMGVPFYKTFFRVSTPVCFPAILEIGMYYFVNSMATISAVIFLYSADIPLASVAVANMDDAGDIAPACAMSMIIVAMNVIVRLFYGLAARGVKSRFQAWRRHP